MTLWNDVFNISEGFAMQNVVLHLLGIYIRAYSLCLCQINNLK